MRLVIIFKDKSDHARSVYEFIEMMRRRYPSLHLEQLELETREGAAEATMYGIMSYPAILATAADGRLMGLWEGIPMPLIDEVMAVVLEQQGTSV